jgi:phosphatidylserine/phosphatidylglycerophosphate/cardiolipin synthase-like enzyme
LDLLRDAKDKGVAIRIMYDVTNTRGDERQKLKALAEIEGSAFLFEAPVFYVCHQKFAVIDGKSVVLGSAKGFLNRNFGDFYTGRDTLRHPQVTLAACP